MARLAHISHSGDGYALLVVEVPLWAVTVEQSGQWLCHRTGNLLCGGWLPDWAWKFGVGRRDEYGWPRWNLGNAVFDFGQWLHGIAGRRERELYRTPLTADEVAERFPDARIPFLET